MKAGDESFERLRSAIETLAASDADELLVEARAQARARVRSLLTDAFAHSMLDRLHEQLAEPAAPTRQPAAARARSEPPPPARPAAPPAAAPAQPRREEEHDQEQGHAQEREHDHEHGQAPRPQPELAWYVYGVIAGDQAGLPPGLRGVDSQAVGVLRAGSLAALTSRVPLDQFGEERLRERLADMAWVEAIARAHEEVLDLARHATTVIPMRMCTVYRTEGGVREMLSREERPLSEALARLEGKTEWGVKVFGDPRRASAAQRHEDPEPGEDERTGAAYMQRLRNERDQVEQVSQELEEASARIHERLCAVSVEAMLAPLQRREVTGRDIDMTMNGVYLVEDAAEDAFHEEVRALSAEFDSLGLELDESGPWPAYNFVPGAIGAAW